MEYCMFSGLKHVSKHVCWQIHRCHEHWWNMVTSFLIFLRRFFSRISYGKKNSRRWKRQKKMQQEHPGIYMYTSLKAKHGTQNKVLEDDIPFQIRWFSGSSRSPSTLASQGARCQCHLQTWQVLDATKAFQQAKVVRSWWIFGVFIGAVGAEFVRFWAAQGDYKITDKEVAKVFVREMCV